MVAGGCRGLAAFAEALLGVGIVVPGEVAIAGIASSTQPGDRVALVAIVTLGATMGDHVNYWIGRALGSRLGRSRLVARIGQRHWDRAVALLRKHGAWAIIVSRLIPVVRTLMAAVAGVSHLRYRVFALASFVGSLLWAAAWVAAGDLVRGVVRNPAWAIPVLLLVVLIVIWRRRRNLRGSDALLEDPLGGFE